jgi:hypothetical protein
VGLKDKLVQAVILRVARGKVDGMRKSGSKALAALDGKKSVIVTVCFVLSGAAAMLTGQDLSHWLDLLLRAFGWTDPEIIDGAKATATEIVPLLLAAWAAGHALVKWYKQRKAGATVAEMGSPVGVVKAALSAGVIVDGRTGTPMADTTAPAEAIPFDVAKKGDVVVVTPVK